MWEGDLVYEGWGKGRAFHESVYSNYPTMNPLDFKYEKLDDTTVYITHTIYSFNIYNNHCCAILKNLIFFKFMESPNLYMENLPLINNSECSELLIYFRSSHQEVFCKKCVRKFLVKILEKYL